MHHSQLAAIQAVKKEIKIYEDLYQDLLFKVSYAAAATDESTHDSECYQTTATGGHSSVHASAEALSKFAAALRAYRHAVCSPVASSAAIRWPFSR
jgi:hypothetical protein